MHKVTMEDVLHRRPVRQFHGKVCCCTPLLTISHMLYSPHLLASGHLFGCLVFRNQPPCSSPCSMLLQLLWVTAIFLPTPLQTTISMGHWQSSWQFVLCVHTCSVAVALHAVLRYTGFTEHMAVVSRLPCQRRGVDGKVGLLQCKPTHCVWDSGAVHQVTMTTKLLCTVHYRVCCILYLCRLSGEGAVLWLVGSQQS